MENFQDSLNKIEMELNSVKTNLKEAHKKTKSCKSANDQDTLNKHL